MKLLVKQKAYAWSEKCAIGKQWADMFTVTNELGEVIFTVSERLFYSGRPLRVFNAVGQQVASVNRKLLRRHTIIKIEEDTYKFFYKKMSLKHAYYLEGTSWQMDGGFWPQGTIFAPGGPGAHDYFVSDNGILIMNMSKRINFWNPDGYSIANWKDTLGDSYELDIPDPENVLMCVCLMLSVYSIMADMLSRGHYH